MNTVVDSLLNIVVFVFIGLLIWLYGKKEPEDKAPDVAKNSPTETKG
ncbi:MAG: hypothetical protein PVG78_08580 [Desulfobacterales bacterium]|jgi:hypothetical protein